ncbi:MAG: FHA domain-containing protein [Anaerolineales bacterium]|nr:FHA domain-containing protein [Anaerolineales bacterium]
MPISPGKLVIGRDPSCDLHLDNKKVSRRHSEIVLQDDVITVTDLNSSNGCFLGSTRLPAGSKTEWSRNQTLHIGPFSLFLDIKREEPTPISMPEEWSIQESAGQLWRIACGHGQPSSITVKNKPVIIGRNNDCDMILDDISISRHQCKIFTRNSQLWVADMSQQESTRIGNDVVSPDAPHVWPEGIQLHLGPFTLLHSVEIIAPLPGMSSPYTTSPANSITHGAEELGTRMWLEWIRQLPWLPISMAFGGLCLLIGISVGLYQVFFKPTPTPVAEIIASSTPPQVSPTSSAIPTDAPVSTPTPTLITGSGTILLPSPTTTYAPLPGCTPQSAGWLELPFPYDGKNQGFGTAEDFRAASQRTAAGGRINSFFDHQFPLYSNEDKLEGVTTSNDTMVLFDGSISLDRTTYPKEEGDFYSGHPGLDFSVFGWEKRNTPIETPILAPADGIFVGAGTDNLGNNYVLLVHDRGEDGVYRTSFLHLEPDGHFERMLAMDLNTPIKKGERIGTMGNTGNSTGHHLHFEIRKDCNDNGLFELAEAIDPYGFSPSIEVPVDPMSSLICGTSEYIWIYTWDPDEEGGGCAQPESRRQLDPTPFQGYVSIGTFIFTTSDPSKLTRVPIWLSRADVRKVELGSIKVHRFEIDPNTGIGNWIVVPDSSVLADSSNNTYVEVYLNIPGKYTVTGRPREDIIPPKTTIQLTGIQSNGLFVDTVTIELIGSDDSRQGVREIHYSLDCGQTWSVYGDIPLHLDAGDLIQCSVDESDQMGDEWGLEQDEYLVLASAVDWSDNWEQPASLQRFKFSK